MTFKYGMLLLSWKFM